MHEYVLHPQQTACVEVTKALWQSCLLFCPGVGSSPWRLPYQIQSLPQWSYLFLCLASWVWEHLAHSRERQDDKGAGAIVYVWLSFTPKPLFVVLMLEGTVWGDFLGKKWKWLNKVQDGFLNQVVTSTHFTVVAMYGSTFVQPSNFIYNASPTKKWRLTKFWRYGCLN